MANANLRKAAVLLLSLSKELAGQLLRKLASEQAKAVAAHMAEVCEIDHSEQEAVVREFAVASTASVERQQPATESPFAFLRDLDSQTLVGVLGDERPQTIALVLSYLPAEQASEVLSNLPAEMQLSMICRVAMMGEVLPEVLREVETAIARRLTGQSEWSGGRRGLANVVKMLNVMEPATERKLLGELAETAPQLVREIRRAMFGPDVAACPQWPMAEAAG